MRNEIEVIQGVRVFAVVERRNDLSVSIYGGDRNVCGSIRFTFTELTQRRAMAKLLDRWRRHATAVTFVATGSTIALQNDLAVFGDQLAPSAG